MSKKYQRKIEEYEDTFDQTPDLWLREEEEGVALMDEAIENGQPMKQRPAKTDIFT